IIAEGPRFPKLAEFYYREVIARVLPVIRARLALAVERGELPHDALARFPQLLVAPALVAIIWSGLFRRLAPLDIRDLMRAPLDVLFGRRSATWAAVASRSHCSRASCSPAATMEKSRPSRAGSRPS